MPDSFTDANREEIVSLAARYHLPAVYAYRFFAERGGLLSYPADQHLIALPMVHSPVPQGRSVQLFARSASGLPGWDECRT